MAKTYYTEKTNSTDNNNLIPEKLQSLIRVCLSDGVLSEDERTVILKKASEMNIDTDVVNVYLNVEVNKINQAHVEGILKKKGKTCPFCGAPVPQLVDKCQECGNFVTPEASAELQEILDRLEDSLVSFKSATSSYSVNEAKAKVERYIRKARMYYSSNPKIKPLLAEVEKEVSEADSRIKWGSRKEEAKSLLKTVFSSRWFLFFLEILAVIIVIKITCNNTESWRGFFVFIEAAVSLYLLVLTARWAADD